MGILSKRCEQGLRAVLFLVAHQEQRAYVSIREIADALEVSFYFLTKILQQLTERGLLHSYRGPAGGVALAQDPSTVSVLQLIECLEGPDLFTSCVLGLAGCGERKPCPLHDAWVSQRQALRERFGRATLADLGQQTQRTGLRLHG